MKEHEHHGHDHIHHEKHAHTENVPSAQEMSPGLMYYDQPHQGRANSFVLTTPLAIIISGALIACGLVLYGFITQGGQAATQVSMFAGKEIDSTDHVIGKVKSDVILIEYSDTECPFCVQVHPTIKKIQADYADRIAFVYRHFPLTQIHPHAFDEARAISCAGTIGGTKKYYEYIDALFGYKTDKKTTQLAATGKEDIARGIGIEASAFAACMNKQETKAIVDASLDDGVTAGVQGTPASFVLVKTKKGYETIGKVDGARPYEYFKAMIEEALAR